MFTPRTHKPYVFWSRFLAGAVILFPYSIAKIDFRSVINSGLSISAHRASPAYAAFEDLHENFDVEMPSIPDSGERLAAGQRVDSRLLSEIPRQRNLVLAGLTLKHPKAFGTPIMVAGESRRQFAVLPIGRSSVATVQANPIQPFATPMPVMSASHPTDDIDPDSLIDNRGQLLSLQNRKQVLMAQLGNQDWSAPTPGQLAQELVTEELLRQGRTPPETPAIENNNNIYGVSIASLEPNPDFSRPLWLNGQIEMTGGLAFVGPENNMVVKRVLNGVVQEQGRIWVTEGRFEIHVQKATGYLVAELQARDGRILGRGEMNLIHLENVPRKGNRVSDIRLALRPTSEGAVFRTASAYSHGDQRIPVADARVEIQAFTNPQKTDSEGLVSEPSLNHASSFVARATAKRHWSSLVVGQANHPQDIRLFSNSLVEALIDLNLERYERREAKQMAIVWGQVMSKGQPLAGATIEMAGNYQPIYFNDMYLPDKKLTRTSANGMFAFLKVKAGVQALRVKANGRMYPAQVFPTDERHVSFLDVEVRDKVVSQFRVFDILDMNKPVNARIRLVGTDEVLPVDADASHPKYIEYSVAADPFMVEAEAGSEYEISRMTFSGSPHLVNVPLISRQWMYELYQATGARTIPGRGSIVGFIDDQDFEVELTGYAPGEPMQIAYFDAGGKVMSGAKTGVAGGGFVIFNAPQGLQTVYIHPTQSRQTYAQVVVAEPQYVHVVTWAAASTRK
jgi:hypothetical protein